MKATLIAMLTTTLAFGTAADAEEPAPSLTQARDAWNAQTAERMGNPEWAAGAKPVGPPQPAPEWLLVPIKHVEGNPAIKYAVGSVKRLTAVPDSYATETDVKKLEGNSGGSLPLAELLCHPQSPMRADPELVAPLLSKLYVVANTIVKNPDGKLSGFYNPAYYKAYYTVRTVFPELLAPEFDKLIRTSIGIAAECAYKGNPTFLDSESQGSWVNAEIRFAEGLYWAGIILANDTYKEAGIGGLERCARSFLPDGGFKYVDNNNETFTYHEANISGLRNFVLVADSELAKQLIIKSRPYYILSLEPPAVSEYSTAASWKPYWNMSMGNTAAAIIACYTGCPHHKRIADLAPARSLLEAAFWRPDLPVAEPPDNYVVFDRNTEGPRGRFGTWSFSGSAREYGDDPRGRSTYSGCMVLDYTKRDEVNRSTWPLNAALQDAQIEVRRTPASEAKERVSHNWGSAKDYYSLTANDRNSYTVGESCAALGGVYDLSAYREAEPSGWGGTQTWIYTPQRIVGLLQIEARKATEADSAYATLKLVSGRAWWGTRKEIKQDGDSFAYGKLNGVFHQYDFRGGFRTNYEDTYSGDAKKTGRVSLLDKLASDNREETLNTYEKGFSRYALVEVFPEGQQGAKAALIESIDGIQAFSLSEPGGTSFQVYHNTTDRELAVEVSVQGNGAVLHKNKQEYRPEWLEDHQPDSASYTGQLAAGQHHVTVPPYGVVLVEGGNR